MLGNKTGCRVLGMVGVGLLLGGCYNLPQRVPVAQDTPPTPVLQQTSATRTSEEAIWRGQKPEGKPNPLNFEEDDEAQGTPIARIRAVVNDVAILEEEIIAAAYQGLLGAQTEAEKAEILQAKLNEIIDREIVLQDAEARLGNRGGGKIINDIKREATKRFEQEWLYKLMNANKYTDVNEFKEYCANNGMSVDLIQRQWERSFIAMEYLRSRLEPAVNRVSHIEISEYYDNNPKEFEIEERMEWQDIFISKERFRNATEARNFAESIVARLRLGQDFVALSKQFDQGDSSLRANSLGIGHKRGEIRPPEVEATLVALKEGEIGPIIEMEHGYHIVKMYKYVPAGKRPFDEKVQRAIKNKLQNDIFQREMKRFVQELRRRSVIQVAEVLK
jgi:peptidyl-prolyl cis-trans isomerase C